MKFSQLVEHVSKKPIPSYVKHLIVEVMVSDEEGEDVEVCGASSLTQFQTKTNNRFRSLLSESNVPVLRRKEDYRILRSNCCNNRGYICSSSGCQRNRSMCIVSMTKSIRCNYVNQIA